MRHRYNGREVLLNTLEDIHWLRTSHLKGYTLPPFQSFLMFGHEDSPSRLILYASIDPLIQDPIVAEFVLFPDANLSRRRLERVT